MPPVGLFAEYPLIQKQLFLYSSEAPCALYIVNRPESDAEAI